MADWSTKNIQLIQEASRHAEAKMAAQVALATSADARASILAGFYGAAATGCLVIAGTGAALSGASLAAIATAGALFMVGAFLCVWAAWPRDFRLPGNEPSKWYEDIETGASLVQAQGEQLEWFDKHIAENNKTLASNAAWFKCGVVAGLAAPVAGALVGIAVRYWIA